MFLPVSARVSPSGPMYHRRTARAHTHRRMSKWLYTTCTRDLVTYARGAVPDDYSKYEMIVQAKWLVADEMSASHLDMSSSAVDMFK